MTLHALVQWAASEFAASGLTPDEASTAAANIALSPVTNGQLVTAVTMVTTGRGVALTPQGLSWWATAAAALPKTRLFGGEPDYAWVAVAEHLAEPADDCWDPNWPQHKDAWALLRNDARAGDSYVVGNGEGMRARVEVVEQEDRLEAVITSSWGSLDGVWQEAMAEARRVLSAP